MKISPSPNYNISSLHKWLDFELSGIVLGVLSYVYIITMPLAILAAVVFIPFLIKVLYEERRYGWFIFLILFVFLVPAVVFYYTQNTNWRIASIYTALGCFYFYCGLLRLIIPSWYHDEEDL